MVGRRSRIAEAYVQLIPSMDGFGDEIQSQLDDVDFDLDAGDAGADAAGSFGSGFAGAIGSVLDKLKIGSIIAGAVSTIGAGLILKSGLERALNIENAEAQLKGLKYTASQIAGIRDNVLDSVRGTAYSLDDALAIGSTALASGIKQGTSLTDYLKLITDTATITGRSLGDIGLIFNSVQSVGKAYTQDLNQLAQSGLPIYAYLQKELGVSAEALSKMVAKGEVDSETFRKAIQDNIGGAALASADTTTGAAANIGAALARLGAAATGGALPIAQQFFVRMIPLVDTLTAKLQPLADSFWQKFGAVALPILSKVIKYINDLVSGKVDFNSGILGFLTDVAASLYTTFQPVVIALIPLVRAIGTAAVGLIGPLANVFVQFSPFLTLVRELTPFIAQMARYLGEFLKALTPLAGSVINIVASALYTLSSFLLDNLELVKLAILIYAGFKLGGFILLIAQLTNALLVNTAAWIQNTAAVIAARIQAAVTWISNAIQYIIIWTYVVGSNTAAWIANAAAVIAARAVIIGNWIAATATAIYGQVVAIAAATAAWIANAASVVAARAALVGAWIAAAATALYGQVAAIVAATGAWIANAAAVVASRVAMVAVWVATRVATAAMWLFNAAFVASPIGIWVIAIGLAIAAIVLIAQKTTFFQDAWKNTTDFVGSSIKFITDALTSAANFIGIAFAKMGEGLTNIFRGIGNFFISVVNSIVKAINYVIGMINRIQVPVPDFLKGTFGNSIGFNIPMVSYAPALWTGGDIKGTKDGTLIRAGDRYKDETIVNRGLQNKVLSKIERRLDNEKNTEQTGKYAGLTIDIRETDNARVTSQKVLDELNWLG